MNLPFSIHFEKRTEDVPKWLPPLTAIASVLVAFLISGIILIIIGGDPIRSLGILF